MRALSGIVFVALIVASIWFGPLSFAILFTLITIISTFEFYTLINQYQEQNISRILNCTGAGILFISSYLYKTNTYDSNIFLIYVLYLIVLFISGLYTKHENPLQSWAYTIMGQIYIALPFSLLNFISFSEVSIFGIEITKNVEYSPLLLLALFVFIWLNDTGAYLVGSQIGKNRLFERISPKKSWEGFFGGIAFAMLAGFGFSFLQNDYNTMQCIGMGMIVSIFATWGDLTESLLKRTLGVKDSGNMIPGHGGFLDRFDSVLLAAPAYLIYLKIIGLF